MPRYDYTCGEHVFEVTKISYKDKQPIEACPECGMDSEWIPSATFMQPDNLWNGYYSDALGRYFTSKSELRRYETQRGVARVEPGMKEDVVRQKQYAEEKKDQERRKFIEEEVRKF
jgi:hypothetical protein